MAAIEWTDEQGLAIEFDESSRLLVSAAAGSGKTAVLTERITNRALKASVKLPRLLVMTFTELAAKQMKAKIMARFRELRASATDENEKAHFDSLIRELPLAQISTIHAFCNLVLSSHLSEFTDKSGRPLLEPGYRILEGNEEQVLLDEAIDSVLSVLYADLDMLEKQDDVDGADVDGADVDGTDIDSADIDSADDMARASYNDEVPIGLPNLTSDIAPFIMIRSSCSKAEWLRDFKAISLAYAPGMDDRAFRETIGSMLEQMRNLPHYEELMISSLETFMKDTSSFPVGEAYDYWWNLFYSTLDTATRALDELRLTSHYSRLFADSPKKQKHLIDLANATEAMERVIVTLGTSTVRSAERWDAIVECGRSLPLLELPSFSSSKSTNEEVIAKNDYLEQFFREVFPLAALISNKVNRDSARNMKYISHTSPVFTILTEEARESMRETVGPVARFLETVLLVDREYKKKRFSRNAILFSDIEHGALAILEKEDVKKNVSELFDEIYIDEYQDTSSIQDAIITAIDRDNVFMVGDIKQSIYRFRYANPDLFAKRAEKSLICRPKQPIEKRTREHSGYLALLNRNFRSRPGIINFVNDVFSAFLTKQSGEIEYDETQSLSADRKSADVTEKSSPLYTPEVVWEIATNTDEDLTIEELLVDVEKEQRLPSTAPAIDIPRSSIRKEAFMAVRVIGDLLNAGAKHETIAILLPTNDNCRQYEEVLTSCGIPVTSRSGRVFADNLVSRQIEALLSVLDNPRQDVPLLSVMIGPFAPDPFSSEELISISREKFDADHVSEGDGEIIDEKNGDGRQRIKKRTDVYFHDRAHQIGEREEISPLGEKIRHFQERMKRWRLLATELNPREWLDMVLFESDYPSYIARGPLGPSHYLELEQLATLFDSYDRPDQLGVRAMLHRLKESIGQPIQLETETGESLEGAVNLLTRHSSKGLQWDYIILGGLSRQDAGGRTESLISYSEQDGLSSFTIGDDGLTVYNNALNQLFRLSEDKRNRAEAWRLLYVAMTRAKERLILLSPAKKTLGDASGFKTILEEADYLTPSLSHDDREKRAVVPESLASSTSNDAELLFSVLAVREPDLTREMAMAEKGIFKFRHMESNISPWSEVACDVIRWRAQQMVLEENNQTKTRSTQPSEEEQTIDSIIALLSAQIPRQDAATTPAKITVTELKRISDEPLDSFLSDSEEREPRAVSLEDLKHTFSLDDKKQCSTIDNTKRVIPYDDIKTKMTRSDMSLTMRKREEQKAFVGAALGTMMHTIFQFMDIEDLRKQPPAEVERACLSQLENMVEKKILSTEQLEAAKPFTSQMVAWANSSLADRLMHVEQTTGRVYREMPFTMALASSELHESFPSDEITLVQGMIDLWFVEDDDKAVLVDFKTDDLPDLDLAETTIRERYATQLKYYAQAIKRATGRDVSESIVWLVRYAKEVTF